MPALALVAPEYFLEGLEYSPVGRNYASLYFALSLLLTGRFDEAHFYHSLPVNEALVRGTLARLGPPADGVAVRSFKTPALKAGRQRDAYEWFFVPDLGADFAFLAGLRAAKGAAFRLLGIIHSLNYLSALNELRQLPELPLRRGDTLVCSSSAGRETILRVLGAARSTPRSCLPVIPYGINAEQFTPGDPASARDALSLPRDGRILLCFSRFSLGDKLDHRPLIQAFDLVRGRFHEPWRLLLAGGITDPPYFDGLRQFVAQRGLGEQVIFLADVDEDRRVAVYQASDMFICPSDNFQETFGLAVIEAMACGLPVITSDWNGYKDTVVQGRTGIRLPTFMPLIESMLSTDDADPQLFLFVPSQTVAVDVWAMAAALLDLANDQSRRKQLGRQARAHVLDHYSYQAISRKLAAALDAPAGAPLPAGARPARAMTAWQLFRHYPTRLLQDDDRFRAEDPAVVGRAHLWGVGIQPYLPQGLPQAIHSYCSDWRSLGEIRAGLSSAWSDADRVRYVVAWLYKHALLRFQPGSN